MVKTNFMFIAGTLMRDALSVIEEEVNHSIISIMILSRNISRKIISYV
jgi:hypothetical protein